MKRDRTKEYAKAKLRSKTDALFVANLLYNKQLARAKIHKHKVVGYSREYFIQWLYEQDYLQLFNLWVLSGNFKGLRPSIDRINPKKGYIVGNIQLMTWEENDIKGNLERFETSTQMKAVLQFTKDGEFIAEYRSVGEASRAVAPHLKNHSKTKLYMVLNKKKHYNTFYGYKFEYKEDYL